MRLIITILFIVTFYLAGHGQRSKLILQGLRADSSFYQIEQIGENEFWMGGEYGILKRIDTLGNISSVNLPNLGKDITQIKKVDNFVYILTADAVIYRYDIIEGSFLTKTFAAFRNRCFYDFIVRKDGSILVCGGTTGIAEGKPVIPRGFIAELSPDLSEINVVWKSFRKFVWSLLEQADQSVLAVTFNGMCTSILKSQSLQSWKKVARIKGLVHEINNINGQVWYSGARSIKFGKNGITGRLKDIWTKVKGTGCIWRLDQFNDLMMGVTYSGELLLLNAVGEIAGRIDLPKKFSLYDMEQLTPSKLLVVGRGKTAYLVDFSQE